MKQIVPLVFSEWTYLGEGNQHIILKYVGESKYLIDKVLRVEKDRDHKEYTNSNMIEIYKSLH